MEAVIVSDLGASSILTLMLKQILDTNLNDPEKFRLVRHRTFTAVFRAGKMLSTLVFEEGKVRAMAGATASPDVRVSGDIRTLIDLAAGGNPFVPFVKGRLTVRVSRFAGLIACGVVFCIVRKGRLPLCVRWLNNQS